jgi:ABC-type sugar transport system ATPase subunit
VIARWLRTDPRALLLDEPTQGVDVGAKAAIHALLDRAAGEGAAVLVSSTDAKELTDICDRILVMRDGHVVAKLEGAEIEEERLIKEELGFDADAPDTETQEEIRA